MASKPIVVGTDGREQSLRAVIWAAREAVLRDVALRIVSVAAPGAGAGRPSGHGGYRVTSHQTAGEALEDAAESARMTAPRLTIDTSLLSGEPGPVLAGLGGHPSMLVAGSRGPAAPAATAAGLAGRYVAAHAMCPVVIHHEQAVPEQQVVVSVHDVDDCEAPIGFAFEEASRRGAHLLAVQAWYWLPPAAVPAADSSLGPAQLSGQALIRLHRLLEPWQEKYPDVETGEEIIHARPWHALAGLTATAGLLVLGRHPHPFGGTDAPLGTVTNMVLAHAHGPVAIVSDQPAARA